MAQSPRQRTCHEVLYSVDSYGAACCQFQSTPCVWCSAFRGSPPPISQTENDPYVRIAGEVDADSSLIGFFMRDHEESEDCSSKADLVEDFCAGANIAPQEWETDVDANEDANTRPIALVDDRSNDGRTAVSRTNPGPLTAEQLLWYLSTMVVSFLHTLMYPRKLILCYSALGKALRSGEKTIYKLHGNL